MFNSFLPTVKIIMNDEAVSNIIGAFILVLIVVSAATGFAMYVSETQKTTTQMGYNMVEYGLEELGITSTYNTLTFQGWNGTENNYSGVGLLLTNPGIRDIRVQGILIDGKYIIKGNLYIINEQMKLYNYTFDSNFKGFKAIGQRSIGQNWSNVSAQNLSLTLPQSSIIRIMFTDDLLKIKFGIDTNLPTHTLEIISARGRYFTTTFAYS